MGKNFQTAAGSSPAALPSGVASRRRMCCSMVTPAASRQRRMVFVWLLLPTILSTQFHQIAGPPPPLFPEGRRVVGGDIAEQGNFLYVVALVRKADQEVICGGVVFDERHVLTAAHCIDESDPASSLRVLVGVANKSDLLNPQRSEFEILQEYKHNLYANGEKHDISLLRVNGHFSIKVLVSRPPFAVPNMLVPYLQCTLAGWGSTFPQKAGDIVERAEEAFPEVLNYAIFPLLATDTCQDIYWNIDLSPELLCAGNIEGGKDGCVGDSGSPLVCEGRMVGLMAAGAGCAQALQPGVYLNITHYHPWIDKAVKRSYREERAELLARTRQRARHRHRHHHSHLLHYHHRRHHHEELSEWSPAPSWAQLRGAALLRRQMPGARSSRGQRPVWLTSPPEPRTSLTLTPSTRTPSPPSAPAFPRPPIRPGPRSFARPFLRSFPGPPVRETPCQFAPPSPFLSLCPSPRKEPTPFFLTRLPPLTSSPLIRRSQLQSLN